MCALFHKPKPTYLCALQGWGLWHKNYTLIENNSSGSQIPCVRSADPLPRPLPELAFGVWRWRVPMSLPGSGVSLRQFPGSRRSLLNEGKLLPG